MNRRGFIKLLGGVVAGIALDQAIPGNRVWSFPKNIVIADPPCSTISIALQLEKVRHLLVPTLYRKDAVLFEALNKQIYERFPDMDFDPALLVN